MKPVLESVSFLGLRILSSFLAMLPPRVALGIGAILGRFYFLFSKRKHPAYADLKSAFGDRFTPRERWRIVKKHFSHLGQLGVEVVRIPSLNQKFVEGMIDIHNIERFYGSIDEGKGVVLMTAHFGNWELLHSVSAVLGKPMNLLARKQKKERFNEHLNRLRESHGSKKIARGMGVRGLFKALKRNELIGLLGDQDAGKKGGVVLPFFGRKTTVPTGAFEMARRSGAPILPCFDLRKEDGKHEIFVGEPIRCGEGDYELEELKPFILSYLTNLENLITQHPEQWLWGSKRWKYSWTKRLLILSDGKKGHLKQAEALAHQMQGLKTQFDREGMEYPTETIKVQYRSPFHKRFFGVFALLFLPWIQGRLFLLRSFLTEECYRQLQHAQADFVISAGNSLVPLNLCLAKECHGKSIVVMKPSFPYDRLRYDLAVVPIHDQGHVPQETFRSFLTPSVCDTTVMNEATENLKKQLKNPNAVKIGVLLGGDTRDFKMDLSGVEKLVMALEHSKKDVGDYLLTTSRRTSSIITSFLKDRESILKGCQKLIIASEEAQENSVYGMLQMADLLIVTEDSISMISEALSAGKRVIVYSFDSHGLPQKHRRFKNALEEKEAVVVAHAGNVAEKIKEILVRDNKIDYVLEEQKALRERLQAIL